MSITAMGKILIRDLNIFWLMTSIGNNSQGTLDCRLAIRAFYGGDKN